MNSNSAAISIAKRDTQVFPETKANDVLFYVKADSTQNIHIGHANNNGAMISVYKPIVNIRALEVLNNATVDADLHVEGMTTTKNFRCRGTILMESNLVPTTSNIALGLSNVPFSNAFLQTLTTNNLRTNTLSLCNVDLGSTLSNVLGALSNLNTQVVSIKTYLNLP
jgi:hypothetical protein